MMAVDTSALMAIVLIERQAAVCATALSVEPNLLISAVTVAEAFVVAERKGVSAKMADLIDRLDFDIAPVNAATAQRVGEIYQRWGKGRHPAGLNFGDCFAYDVAKTHACPLLFVGDDFRKTDLQSAI